MTIPVWIDLAKVDEAAVEQAERQFRPLEVFDSRNPEAKPIRMEPFMLAALRGGRRG